MLKTLEKLRVLVIVRVGLRFFPNRIPETLRTFSSTEADTAWQLLQGANRISDPVFRARLIPQILEETEHAEIFSEIYRDVTGKKMKPLLLERRPLMKAGQAPWKLLLYCWIGEADAVARLGHIAHALPPGRIRAALDRILEEEAGHVGLASGLIRIQGVEQRLVSREARAIRIRRAWEIWLRLGRQLTAIAANLILKSVYFTAGAIFARETRYENPRTELRLS